ncbi:MFS family permease [Thermocatellispora tengchongensis]|uniref:MFS family permease n=1 Tax=Thermocatellispora tengchongensis TaxID=1073253 RepID=A0A840NZU4_9ACTN|nr:MFS transporter [Thermocatellispora tengchongensis]MBB5132269.1 MFS family permease [Thermocatellispora tengchongensis]
MTTTTTKEPPGGQSTADSGFRAYAKVVRTRGMRAWTFIVLCQRLPIAMSPLALVYIGHHAGSSYAVGALLAGAFAFAEALAAGVMGRRFDRRAAGPELRLVLTLQAAALFLLGVPALVQPGLLPVWALVVLAALAGGIASGAHGGLRALLLRTVDPSGHHAALSLESTLTTLLWAVGPAVVGLIALFAGEIWPTVVIGVIAAVGAVAAGALRDSGPVSSGHEKAADVRVWRLSWPALFQEGAVMMCVGAAYTGLPSLLELVGSDPGVAGPVLALFAGAGLIGGLIYGSRTWPGAYRTQSFALVLAVIVVVAVAVVTPTAATIITLLIISGFAGTPALTARAAGMQELLPERVWATGFSGLYAAGGIGFAASGIVVAALLEAAGIRVSLLVCVALAAAAALISGAAESRMARSRMAAQARDHAATA